MTKREGGAPAGARWRKLEIFVPASHLGAVQQALRTAGAGRVGVYEGCMAYSEVTGCWHAPAGARPYLGRAGEDGSAPEIKIEVRVEAEAAGAAIEAVRRVHPYEEPMIYCLPTD